MEIRFMANNLEKDYRDSWRYHGRNNRIGWSVGTFVFLVLVVMAGQRFDTGSVPYAIIYGAIFAAIQIVYMNINLLYRCRRMYKNLAFRDLETEIVVNSEGIHYYNSNSTYHVEYGMIVKVVEVKSAFYISLSKVNVGIMPKRYIPDVSAFRAFLTEHVDAGKLKLREK